MEGPMQKGDREDQDSSKEERSRGMNQSLGNWKKTRKKRSCVSGAVCWVDHRKDRFPGLKGQILTMSCDSV